MIVAREERGTNVERGHGGWRMTVRLNTLMNVRRFFLLLMMTPVQMERMLATVRLPMGGGDWCTGDWRASDECTTGTDEDDLCISTENSNGAFDVCPGGRSEVDRCAEQSDDYCVAGVEGSDECSDGLPENDECAGGLPEEDVCYKYVSGSDECVTGVSGSDQSSCKIPPIDECFANEDKCSASFFIDSPE